MVNKDDLSSALNDAKEAAKAEKAAETAVENLYEDENPKARAAHAATSASASTESADEASPKKKKNKWVTLGVIAGIIAIAALGFMVWHEQPSFCNAVCHSPMDNYVASASEGDPGMLVTSHIENGVNCLKCHNPKLTEQLTEVCMWVSDEYPVDAEGNLVNADAQNMASEEFCLKSGCHESLQTVVENTWGFAGNDEKYNPHSSHQDGSIECGDCHKSHEKSTLYCAKCHDMNLPEGWEATSE